MKAPGRGLVRVQTLRPSRQRNVQPLKTNSLSGISSRAARPFSTRGGMPADKTGAQLQSVAATPASAASNAHAGAKINPQRASSAPSSFALTSAGCSARPTPWRNAPCVNAHARAHASHGPSRTSSSVGTCACASAAGGMPTGPCKLCPCRRARRPSSAWRAARSRPFAAQSRPVIKRI